MIAAANAFRRWRGFPQQFVREVFGVVPDAWQDDVLAAFPANPRLAMKACKGPGKTAVLAWLAWNFLLTRPHPKIAATSVTGDNLADNLWAEMAKWQGQSELLKATFEWQKTRIICRDHPETWWMSARPWSRSASREEQGLALAGLHADYIMFILDESGGIPDAVMVSADAALSSCKEGHIVQAGNPTHLEGPLYRACTTERRLWHITEITGDPDDPKRSPRVKVEWAREQIEKYGRDNPWVLINVFGRFPPSSINALIGSDECADATRRFYREADIDHAARILGVDVARFGDDSSVIFPRQGLVAFPPIQYRNLDSATGGGAVAGKWRDWSADACFVDDSGGYGAGWIDALRGLGRSPIGISFASRPTDLRYLNKRAEMYFLAVQWIKDGGAIPNCPELISALTQMTYAFKGDRMMIEDKDQLKQRIGFSPDHADALALTFAQPVSKQRPVIGAGRKQHQYEYDPYAGRA
jgi:hypothetical protein